MKTLLTISKKKDNTWEDDKICIKTEGEVKISNELFKNVLEQECRGGQIEIVESGGCLYAIVRNRKGVIWDWYREDIGWQRSLINEGCFQFVSVGTHELIITKTYPECKCRRFFNQSQRKWSSEPRFDHYEFMEKNGGYIYAFDVTAEGKKMAAFDIVERKWLDPADIMDLS